MEKSKKRKRRGIQSVDTGIRLLEAMEKAEGPLALKELSARADMDPSSAHRYLASFARCGLVRQQPDSRYDFGPLALRVGLAAVRRLDPVQLIEQALPHQLMARTSYAITRDGVHCRLEVPLDQMLDGVASQRHGAA